MCRKLSLPARELHENSHTPLRQQFLCFLSAHRLFTKNHTKQKKHFLWILWPKGLTLGILSLLSCKPMWHTFISDCLAKVNIGIICKALPGFRVIQSFCCSRTERIQILKCETFTVGLAVPQSSVGQGLLQKCPVCPVHHHSSLTNQ